MLRIAAATLAASLARVSCQTTIRPTQNDTLDPLRFNRDGTFQICIFSDLHFAEGATLVTPSTSSASLTDGEQMRQVMVQTKIDNLYRSCQTFSILIHQTWSC